MKEKGIEAKLNLEVSKPEQEYDRDYYEKIAKWFVEHIGLKSKRELADELGISMSTLDNLLENFQLMKKTRKKYRNVKHEKSRLAKKWLSELKDVVLEYLEESNHITFMQYLQIIHKKKTFDKYFVTVYKDKYPCNHKNYLKLFRLFRDLSRTWPKEKERFERAKRKCKKIMLERLCVDFHKEKEQSKRRSLVAYVLNKGQEFGDVIYEEFRKWRNEKTNKQKEEILQYEEDLFKEFLKEAYE